MGDMKKLGSKVFEARKIKGFSQEELANRAQVSIRTIQRIENGENDPRGKTLELICDALQINLEDIKKSHFESNYRSNLDLMIHGVFLFILNMVLISIIGYLTLDSAANINSRFGGVLASFFVPAFIVFFTPKMTGKIRLLKFGFGYFTYFLLVIALLGFPIGFTTWLFPCLLISVTVLYFGSDVLIPDKEISRD